MLAIRKGGDKQKKVEHYKEIWSPWLLWKAKKMKEWLCKVLEIRMIAEDKGRSKDLKGEFGGSIEPENEIAKGNLRLLAN